MGSAGTFLPIRNKGHPNSMFTDTARDPRGFSIKIRTEEGNWDWVFNDTPVFFIRDPAKFPHFIHTQKRNPQTHLKDADMFWVRFYLPHPICFSHDLPLNLGLPLVKSGIPNAATTPLL